MKKKKTDEEIIDEMRGAFSRQMRDTLEQILGDINREDFTLPLAILRIRELEALLDGAEGRERVARANAQSAISRMLADPRCDECSWKRLARNVKGMLGGTPESAKNLSPDGRRVIDMINEELNWPDG
jgi:hypothetical protein